MKKNIFFYRISHDANLMKIYPQIQTLDYKRPIKNIRRAELDNDDVLPLSDDYIFDRFIIEKRAKKTDILSTAPLGDGLILSERIVSIVLQHNLPPHKVYPAIIQKRGTDVFYEGYYYFLFERSMYRHLSFADMKFHKVTFDERNQRIKEDIHIESLEEYLEARNQGIRIANANPNTYVFGHSFPLDIDIFGLGEFEGYVTYASERLKNALEEVNMTGIEFERKDTLFLRGDD